MTACRSSAQRNRVSKAVGAIISTGYGGPRRSKRIFVLDKPDISSAGLMISLAAFLREQSRMASKDLGPCGTNQPLETHGSQDLLEKGFRKTLAKISPDLESLSHTVAMQKSWHRRGFTGLSANLSTAKLLGERHVSTHFSTQRRSVAGKPFETMGLT